MIHATAAAKATERRAQPRHKMSAQVKVRQAVTGRSISARLIDVSRGGCFVETENPLPVGTATDIIISKAAQTFHFQAVAKVVSNLPSKGMGLEFTTVREEQFRTLGAWIDASARFYRWSGKFVASWPEAAASSLFCCSPTTASQHRRTNVPSAQ